RGCVALFAERLVVERLCCWSSSRSNCDWLARCAAFRWAALLRVPERLLGVPDSSSCCWLLIDDSESSYCLELCPHAGQATRPAPSATSQKCFDVQRIPCFPL